MFVVVKVVMSNCHGIQATTPPPSPPLQMLPDISALA